MEPIELAICIVANAAPTISLPAYQTEGAAGFDLQANIRRYVMLQPHDWMLVPTGLMMAIPQGFEGQIRPRSGLAAKAGITVLNAPGTIDSDYRGEVGVVLINHSGAPFQINPGDRIAQMVIAAVTRPTIRLATDMSGLSETERGVGGFGHTGL